MIKLIKNLSTIAMKIVSNELNIALALFLMPFHKATKPLATPGPYNESPISSPNICRQKMNKIAPTKQIKKSTIPEMVAVLLAALLSFHFLVKRMLLLLLIFLFLLF